MRDITVCWFNKHGDYRDKELVNLKRKILLKLQAAIQAVLDTKPSAEEVQLGAVSVKPGLAEIDMTAAKGPKKSRVKEEEDK